MRLVTAALTCVLVSSLSIFWLAAFIDLTSGAASSQQVGPLYEDPTFPQLGAASSVAYAMWQSLHFPSIAEETASFGIFSFGMLALSLLAFLLLTRSLRKSLAFGMVNVIIFEVALWALTPIVMFTAAAESLLGFYVSGVYLLSNSFALGAAISILSVLILQGHLQRMTRSKTALCIMVLAVASVTLLSYGLSIPKPPEPNLPVCSSLPSYTQNFTGALACKQLQTQHDFAIVAWEESMAPVPLMISAFTGETLAVLGASVACVKLGLTRLVRFH